ncbi:MAG: hypothetical protein ABI432_09335 [Flavobacteriales bacterium]
MASSYYTQRPNYFAIAAREKVLLERHYTFLKNRLDQFGLVSTGVFQPTPYSTPFKYRVIYRPPAKPKVFIRAPHIAYSDDIHMYPYDNSLCLYYPKDFLWQTSCNLYDTIVPWTHGWILNYELYQITGRWHHPSVAHRPGHKGLAV